MPLVVWYEFGDYRYSPQAGLFRVGQDAVMPLGNVERRILELLLRHSGQVVPTEEIRRRIWGQRTVSENIVNAYITRLRTALGDIRRTRGLHAYIRHEQHPTAGYVLAQSVRRFEREEAASAIGWPLWAEPLRLWLRADGLYAVAVSILYGTLLTFAFLIEIAYLFDRFAGIARFVAPATLIWGTTSSLAAFWIRSQRAVFGSDSLSFVGMVLLLFASLFGWFAIVRLYLPTDPIVRFTESQAYPAQAGLFKTAVWQSAPLLLVCPLLYHAALRFREDAASEAPGGLSWRVYVWMGIDGALWLAMFGVLVGYSIPVTNHMIDVTVAGPYRNLFALLVWTRLGIWYTILTLTLLWFSGILSKIRTQLDSP